MKKNLSFLFLFLILILPLEGQISLPRLISHGAILQRDQPLRIWGWAAPHESLVLEFNDESFPARANAEGKWMILLKPQPAGGPFTLRFLASNQVEVRDVYFGDVWLCSGQSNMELSMERVKEKYPEIIRRSALGQVRQFVVPDRYDFNRVHADVESGKWVAASPETVLDFSAVGFFFARDLYLEKNVPIGLINAALGGSPVEAWMSEEILQAYPESLAEMQRFKDQSLIDSIQAAERARSERWYSELNAKDQGMQDEMPKWSAPNWPDDDWTDFQLPGYWADQFMGQVNGVLWFRKKINVPASMIGKPVKFWLGRIVDQDFAYVNGEFVGTIGYQYPPRRYEIPAGILRAGENTIAIRVINNGGRGGFVPDKPYYLATETDTLDLRGTWKAKVGATMPPLPGQTFVRWKPGGLYNQMIHPLLNYRIKGALWYQGESNAGRPDDYQEKLSDMIRDWRLRWAQGDFPFLIVQLTNFMEANTEPVESSWARLRQEQLQTSREVENAGLVVAIDLGEWNDIHPLDKQSVGERLADLARRLAYGEKKVALSPVPLRSSFKKDRVIIHFDHASGGLVVKGGGPIRHLAISGDGKNFRWAQAKLKGKKLIVWHEDIAEPVAVRYAWSDNPEGANLYNEAGLPATPFELRRD